MQSGFTKYFLFQGESVGGAMTVRKYWHIELFRLGLWSGDRSLAVIGHCTLSYDNIVSFGEGWSFATPQCLHGLRNCHNSDHGPMTWLTSFELYIVKRPGAIHQSIKTCHFLFPPGGAVILGHNFCVKVIRPGLLSYMSSLDSIGPCMS